MKFIPRKLKKANPIIRSGLFLSGAIIGIGVFALPFVVYQAGLVRGLITLIITGLICWLLNLAYVQVVLASKKNCQLGGYGREYWGWPGWLLGGLAILVNANGAILAYLIGAGDFLHFLLPVASPLVWVLFFWLITLGVSVLGFKTIVKIGSLATLLLVILIIIFLFWGVARVNPINFIPSGQPRFIQIISIFFFAYAGFTVIPEIGEILNFRKKPIFLAVTLGSFLPIILYSLFIVIGLGLLGDQISKEFIFSLSDVSFFLSRLGAVIAMLTIISSFFAFTFVLKEFWSKDLGFNQLVSFGLAFLPSLLFYLLGIRDFLMVISLTGGVSCLLIVIVILFCWFKEKFSRG